MTQSLTDPAVLAVAINQHMTVLGNFRALKHSPTLRFIVIGAMMYTLASVQGSMESLRNVNLVTQPVTDAVIDFWLDPSSL